MNQIARYVIAPIVICSILHICKTFSSHQSIEEEQARVMTSMKSYFRLLSISVYFHHLFLFEEAKAGSLSIFLFQTLSLLNFWIILESPAYCKNASLLHNLSKFAQFNALVYSEN